MRMRFGRYVGRCYGCFGVGKGDMCCFLRFLIWVDNGFSYNGLVG